MVVGRLLGLEPQVPDLNKLRKGRNVLQTQMKRGHVNVCRAILGRPDFLLVTAPRMLHHAAGCGQHTLAKPLLSRPDLADVNVVEGARTPLCMAGFGGQFVILRPHQMET